MAQLVDQLDEDEHGPEPQPVARLDRVAGGGLQIAPVRGDRGDTRRSPRPARDRAILLKNSRITGIQRLRNRSGSHSGMRGNRTFISRPCILRLVKLLVPAQQHGGIGRDVGFDQVGGVKLREDLNDFRLRRRIIGELPADQIPRFADGARAVEQADEAVGRIGEAVELVARRIAHDVPALAAIVLPRDLRRPAGGLQLSGDAVPGFGKCGA